jgi:hypothetical protein
MQNTISKFSSIWFCSFGKEVENVKSLKNGSRMPSDGPLVQVALKQFSRTRIIIFQQVIIVKLISMHSAVKCRNLTT